MTENLIPHPTAEEIVTKACAQETLDKALVFAAICEMERVAPIIRVGQQWETCFGFLFRLILERWEQKVKKA